MRTPSRACEQHARALPTRRLNCEVTLTGTVGTRREKFLAEEIADDVGGVTDVHNQLRVGRGQSQQVGTSTDVTSSAQSGTEAARNRNARAQ